MKRPGRPCDNNNTSFKRTKHFHYVANNYNPAHSFPRSLDDPATPPHASHQTSLCRVSRKPRFVMGKLPLDSSPSDSVRPASRHLKLRPPNFLKKPSSHSLSHSQSNDEDPIATPVFSTPRYASRQPSGPIRRHHPDNSHNSRHSPHKSSSRTWQVSSEPTNTDGRVSKEHRNCLLYPTLQPSGGRTNLPEVARPLVIAHGSLALLQAYVSESDETSSSSCDVPHPSNLHSPRKHCVALNQRILTPSPPQLSISISEEKPLSPSPERRNPQYLSTEPNQPGSHMRTFSPPAQQRDHISPPRTSHFPQSEPVCAVTPAHCTRRLAQSLAPTPFQTPFLEQVQTGRREPAYTRTPGRNRNEGTPRALLFEQDAANTNCGSQARDIPFCLPWDSPLGFNDGSKGNSAGEPLIATEKTPEELRKTNRAEQMMTGGGQTLQEYHGEDGASPHVENNSKRSSMGSIVPSSGAGEIRPAFNIVSTERREKFSMVGSGWLLAEIPEASHVVAEEVKHHLSEGECKVLGNSPQDLPSQVLRTRDVKSTGSGEGELGCVGCKFGHFHAKRDKGTVASLEMEPVLIGTHSETIYPSAPHSKELRAEVEKVENEGDRALDGRGTTDEKQQSGHQGVQEGAGHFNGYGQDEASPSLLHLFRSKKNRLNNEVSKKGAANLTTLRGDPVTTVNSSSFVLEHSCAHNERPDLEIIEDKEKVDIERSEERTGAVVEEVSEEGREEDRILKQKKQGREDLESVGEGRNTGQDGQGDECTAKDRSHREQHELQRKGQSTLQIANSPFSQSKRLIHEKARTSYIYLSPMQKSDDRSVEQGMDSRNTGCNDIFSARLPQQRTIEKRNVSWFRKYLGEAGSASPAAQSEIRWEKFEEESGGKVKNTFRRVKSPARMLRVTLSESYESSAEECSRGGENRNERRKEVEIEDSEGEKRNEIDAEDMISVEEDDMYWDAGNVCISLPPHCGKVVHDKNKGNETHAEQAGEEHGEDEADRMTESPPECEDKTEEKDRFEVGKGARDGHKSTHVVCRPLLVRIAAGALRSPSTPASSDDEQRQAM